MQVRLSIATIVLWIVTCSGVCFGWQNPAERTSDVQYTHNPPIKGDKPESKPWSAVVGKKVQVEGIAWPSYKGWGDCVLIDGTQVYVTEGQFLKKKATGKLVRVTGTLSATYIKPAKAGEQGTSVGFTLYDITQPTWEIIEQVQWPWMREIP